MKKLLCCLLLMYFFSSFCGDPLKPSGIPVKLGDISTYTVVIPENASEQDRYAAEILVKYMREITGATLPLKKEEKTRFPGKIISIGETKASKLHNIQTVPYQSYDLSVFDGDLFIKGSLYGVTAFLEEDLGVRWYRGDDKPVIRRVSSTEITVVPRHYTPVFEMREPLFEEAYNNSEWSAFNKIQAFSYYFRGVTPRLGGGISNHKYFIHTYDELIPASVYYETHPEYFPLRKGKRFRSRQSDGQLCYSSPGVADAISRELESAIGKNPASRLYSVSQNDNNNSNCECDECQSVISKDGLSGAAILLANRVAERLSKKYPDIRISTLAYNATQSVPTTIKPSENVAVFYAPIRQRALSLQYLPWSDVPKIMEELSVWGKTAKHLYVWDYINTPKIEPFPNFDVFDRNIEIWRKHGGHGVLLESNMHHLNSLADLKCWVFAKKLWNPDLSIDDLIEDFIQGTYLSAAEEMREYVAIQRNAWRTFYAARKPGNSVRFSNEECRRMENLLEKAYSKLPEKRIASELCCFYAMGLAVCTKENLAQYEKTLKRVEYLLSKHGLSYHSNPKVNQRILAEWKKQLDDVKNGSPIPLYCSKSVILKDRDVHGKVKLIEDKDAYTGKAARQPAGTDWCVQWNFKKLLYSAPNQSVYVARIRVKPCLKRNYPPEDNAFSLHLWRAGISGVQGRYVKFGELKQNDKYQFIDAFKVYMYTPAVSGYFYNCIGKLAADDAILYDCIEFIPLEEFQDKSAAENLPQITL